MPKNGLHISLSLKLEFRSYFHTSIILRLYEKYVASDKVFFPLFEMVASVLLMCRLGTVEQWLKRLILTPRQMSTSLERPWREPVSDPDTVALRSSLARDTFHRVIKSRTPQGKENVIIIFFLGSLLLSSPGKLNSWLLGTTVAVAALRFHCPLSCWVCPCTLCHL